MARPLPRPRRADLADRLTAEDKRGLTPLFWAHVAPYGEVRFDMGRRLALHADTAPEAQ
jgi:hypothetical protein